MNCQQAKDQIDTNSFLNSHGIKPVKVMGSNSWYLSPIHKEKTASFKVNTILNTWYDFGLGEGGTIVDLTTRLFNCGIKEALGILSGSSGIFSPVAKQTNNKPVQTELFNILEVKELNNPALLQYLQSRKINLDIAKLYLKEMYYSYGDRSFFGLSFGNDSNNGFEVRNARFKGFIGQEKTITTINEKENNNLAVFEGYFDFLSYLTYIKKEKLETTSIILNGASMLLQLIEKIEKGSYTKVYNFLDNDPTGKEISSTIADTIKNIPVLDRSGIYKTIKTLMNF